MKKIATICLILLTINAHAILNDDVISLQHRWAVIKYQVNQDKQQQEFSNLLDRANSMLAANIENPDFLVWHAIVESSYAGSLNSVNPFALGYAYSAKSNLEKAIEIDGDVLSGSAYTSLGVLYSKVPGWPLGFGDDEKANQFLLKGLAINPNGIDPNFFYAEYLIKNNKIDEAKPYIQKALNAQQRPNRVIADQGRMKEVKKLKENLGM